MFDEGPLALGSGLWNHRGLGPAPPLSPLPISPPSMPEGNLGPEPSHQWNQVERNWSPWGLASSHGRHPWRVYVGASSLLKGCGGWSQHPAPPPPPPPGGEETVQLGEAWHTRSHPWSASGSGVDWNSASPCPWARTQTAPCWAVLVCGCGSWARWGCGHLCARTWLSVGVLGLQAQHPFPSLNQAFSFCPLPPVSLVSLFSSPTASAHVPEEIKTLIL